MKETLSLPIVSLTRAGNVLYLSGQVAFREWGTLVAGGIEEQTQQTLLNIQHALAAEGAVMDDLVKLNVWITDSADFPAFNRVYATFFTRGFVPARTTVVSGLAIPGSLIEIDGIAVVKDAVSSGGKR